MKNILDKVHSIIKPDEEEEVTPKKAIVFFGFYLVFFGVLIALLVFGGNKNYLTQEYEKGNNTINNKGMLNKNFVFDYKITVDGKLHDYYGKRYEDTESFKYNNVDYYRNNSEFLALKDTWVKCDNPYLFYEFLDFDSMAKILQKATYMTKTEDKDGNVLYHYLITSNTLNELLYSENTDYDEEADSIDVLTNSSNTISKIVYQLDHFCTHRDNCGEKLVIEMNFEMFGSVKKIDNPTA